MSLYLSAILTFALLCLWSYTSVVRNVRLSVSSSFSLSLNIERGRTEWQRIYELKNTVPFAEYLNSTSPKRMRMPAPTTLGFSYKSGLETAIADPPPGDNIYLIETVQLADFWILTIPMWAYLVPASLPMILALLAWYRRKRTNTIGFPVAAGSSISQTDSVSLNLMQKETRTK